MAKRIPRPQTIRETNYTVEVAEQFDQRKGRITTEFWKVNGIPHRDGAPAFLVRHNETGIIIEELWYSNGQAHRADGPSAITRSHETGKITSSSWCIHDKPGKPKRRPEGDSERQALEPHLG